MKLRTINPCLTPNQDLIDTFEALLKEAQDGSLRSYVGVGQYNNSDICRDYVVEPGTNIYQLIGGLTVSIDTAIKANQLTDKVFKD